MNANGNNLNGKIKQKDLAKIGTQKSSSSSEDTDCATILMPKSEYGCK
jgi:hypothetical protein